MSKAHGFTRARADSVNVIDPGGATRSYGPAPQPAEESLPRAAVEQSRTASGAGKREGEKERRLAERGNRILDALAMLIARWGYGKTTVDDIAREAGVAKGTVYLHWPSKGAMLHALLEREEQQWNALILERMATDPGDGTLSSLYRHTLILCAENPLLRALFIQDHDALGEWTRSPQSRARSQRRMEALHGLLRALRAAGLLRADLNVEVQAYLLSALLYGILTLSDVMPPEFMPPFAEVADGFAVIARHGFESAPASAGDGQARRSQPPAAFAVLMSSMREAMTAASETAHSHDDPDGAAQTLSARDNAGYSTRNAGHMAQPEYTAYKGKKEGIA